MQIKAYVTVNGSKPTKSLHIFDFENAKVSDLCIFVAAKAFCSPCSTFSVSVKGADTCLYNVEPDVDLVDKEDMFVTIDPPINDSSSFLLPPASQPRSIATTPSFSQASAASFSDDAVGSSSTSTQRSLISSFGGSATANVTPGAPITFSQETFLEEVQTILANGATGAGPSSSTDHDPSASISPNTLLVSVYFCKREEVEEAFKEMKPEEPVMVDQVNVFEFLDMASRKAALHVLKYPRAYNLEVLAGAKTICKKALVDLLVRAYPSYNCPKNACHRATSYLAAATNNPWFNDLTAADGTSLIVNAFKKRNLRSRMAKSPTNPSTPSTPRAKKRKIVVECLVDGDLDAVVHSFSRCTNNAEIKKLLAETAKVRCSWIKKMEEENAPQILETFLKKFPCFASDASLLHEDYRYNMCFVRELPVVDFGEVFKKMIPAIFKVAAEKRLISPNDPPPTTSDADAWTACHLLIRLVPKYCKRNSNCKPDRLFVEAWELTSINAMHQTRREIKQNAPMIFAQTNYETSKKTYLVGTDDVALKVKGTFCDALQSLMELHYVFDLAYAKELKPFFIILEKLGNVDPSKGYSNLSDLYLDLKFAEACLDAEEARVDDEGAPPVASQSQEPGIQSEASNQEIQPGEQEVVQIE